MGADKFIVGTNFYRFYEDGTEAGSTALAVQNTGISVDVSGGDVQIQLRYSVEETGSGAIAGASTDDYQLEYNSSAGGGNTAVTASSSYVQADTGSSLTDTNATTDRSTEGISNGPGAFFAGEIEAGNGEITDFQHNADDYTEHVWCLLVIAADVSDAETLDFRITLNGGSPGLSNNVTPRITITKTADSATALQFERGATRGVVRGAARGVT
jgi:hypothetical protein